MTRIALLVCLLVAVSVFAQEDERLEEQEETSYNDAQLRCKMSRRCQKLDSCELPCRLVSSSKTNNVVTDATTDKATDFIDEEFEELWDQMQERMKALNEHQEELIAQQNDLLRQQQILEKENRKLKEQQTDLIDRQEYLEAENERLKAIVPGSDDDEEIRQKIRELETKIKTLTQQQKKLSSQQNRLVEQQNRLMARQRKLEGANSKLRKRQQQIEDSGFPLAPSAHPDGQDGPQRDEGKVDSVVESKLEAIKKEMGYRIDQLTGQQEQLLREQTKLINRQAQLEEENDALRAKQEDLYEKQEALEKENQQLRMNFTHRTTDPEARRDRIVATGLCEIEHGNICFGLLGDGTDELTKNDAQENCREYGGDLANLYDEEHYKKVAKYIQKKKISSGVWLGMVYNPLNYKTYLSDGTEAKFMNWNWVYPVSFSSYTSVYLYVDEDPESKYSGMVNLPGTWKYPYALCQFGRA